jgi:DNA-directed RNA polymerase specialized sigma24 family protein
MTLEMWRAPRRTYPPPFDDAAYLKSAERMIRKQGVMRHDVEDVIQLVLAAFARCTTMPAPEPDRTRYQFGIIRNVAIDFATGEGERIDRARLAEPDAVAAPAGPSPEMADLARRVHALATERDPQAADWVVRSAVLGEDQTRIAREEGIPVDRVRKRIERLSAWVRSHADKLAVALLLVIGTWAVSHEEESPTSAPPPPHPPEEDHTTPLQRAASLRSKASSECGAQQWRACLQSLDDARELDPEGDDDPRVQTMRRDAEVGVARESPAQERKP